MMRAFRSKKAQGLVETGVFGILVLIAFSFLVTWIQKMNGEQFTLMENFRHALKDSHDMNSVVSHADLDDSRQADVNAPLRRQRIMRSASGYVHWAVPTITKTNREATLEITPRGWVKWMADFDNDPEREFIYKINPKDYLIDKDAWVSGVKTTYATHIGDNFSVCEGPGNIQSTRTHSSGESLTYSILGATTINQGRGDADSRTFSVSK